MRTKTNAGTAPEFAVVHRDVEGHVVEARIIFSTSLPKAHRKMREMMMWEDDVFAGDDFTLFHNGDPVETFVIEQGQELDEDATGIADAAEAFLAAEVTITA